MKHGRLFLFFIFFTLLILAFTYIICFNVLRNQHQSSHEFPFSMLNATIKWVTYSLAPTLWSPPVIGDINNDGMLEVVIAGTTANGDCGVWALNLKNGSIIWNTTVSTYPLVAPLSIYNLDKDRYLEILVDTKTNIYILDGLKGRLEFSLNTTGFARPLTDINNDGVGEIIVTKKHDLIVYSGLNGSILWKLSWNGLFSKFAFVDFNYDGLWEIVVTYDSNGTHRFPMPDTLILLSADGTLLRSIRLNLSSGDYIFSEPIIVDINKDNSLDVFLSSVYSCFAIDLSSGKILWQLNYLDYLDEHAKKYITWNFGVFPSIGDINSDGELEIVVVSAYLMYIISNDGKLLYYTLLPEYNFIYEGFGAIGDVDGDNRSEIVIGGIHYIWVFDWDEKRFYFTGIGWDQDAKPVTLIDIDEDFDVDVLVTGTDAVFAIDLLNSGFRIDFSFPSINGSYIGNYMLMDPDLDGLSTYSERVIGSNPYSHDSDEDGYGDGYEVANNMNPLKATGRPTRSSNSLVIWVAILFFVIIVIMLFYVKLKKKDSY